MKRNGSPQSCDTNEKRHNVCPSRIKTLPDSFILQLIEDGALVVDIKTAECWHNDRKKKATLCGTEGANGTRYRYEIRVGGIKRTIIRARLVYLAATLKEIPDGYEIHHDDKDRYNDSYGNLICCTNDDHKKLHGQFKYDSDTPF